MDMTMMYPQLQRADPWRRSLADLPPKVVFQILEALFEPAQIVTIEIFGPENEEYHHVDLAGKISSQTDIILRPPPLSIEAATCRLFRAMYQRSRPQTWGDHLSSGVSFNLDLARDIFHVRIHREVYFGDWDRNGSPHEDILEGQLTGVQRMATSANYVSPVGNVWGGCFLRHLNPTCTELMVLIPAQGVERGFGGGLALAPVLRPMGMEEGIFTWYPEDRLNWSYYRTAISSQLGVFRGLQPSNQEQREIWERTWRLSPVPAVEGYVVDERRLRDPKAFGLRKERNWVWTAN